MFRYTAGNGANNRKLTINAANQTITFPVTTSWSTWSTYSVPVTLSAGINTITLAYDTSAGSSDYINLDNLVVQQTTSGTGATPTIFTYDGNGNRLTQNTGTVSTTYTWDATNRLTTTITNQNGTPTTRNVYDADGQRLARRDPDGTITLFLDNQEITIAGPSSPSGTRYYNLDGAPVALRTPSEVDFVAVDRQGSITNTLNAANNTDTRHNRYLPYGTPRSNNNTPGSLRYIGQTLDPTGLTYLNKRYYDAVNALFTATDPLYQPYNTNEINPYSYGQNSPTTNADPSGLRCHDCESGPPPAKTTPAPPNTPTPIRADPKPTPSADDGKVGGGYTCGADCGNPSDGKVGGGYTCGASCPTVGGMIGGGYTCGGLPDCRRHDRRRLHLWRTMRTNPRQLHCGLRISGHAGGNGRSHRNQRNALPGQT